MSTEESIKVMQAYLAGKLVEFKPVNTDEDWKVCGIPRWNFEDYEYRVKPERHSGWINIYKIEDIQTGSIIFNTKESAMKVGKTTLHYVTTIQITWEE